ncbi:inositol 2-dehydrogenase [Rudaea sp.]|uniref:inositol 2-dehydrogenase n=1 Tax=Rudaea sp. TaxID=2136325 RepID=UPI0037841451
MKVRTPATTMLEVALFGAGRIGRIHAGNIAVTPGLRLRYVIDVNVAAAEELAAAFAATATDAERALADPLVAAVVIAASTAMHAELITRAAHAGKAIFCEKPVAAELDDARACAGVVAEAGVACMIGFQRRFDPTFAALKRRLDAGEIGAAEVVVLTSRDPAPPPLEYLKQSGGVFKDMLIHDFDVCRWLLADEILEIHATGACLSPDAAQAHDLDTAAVTLRSRRGCLCVINTSRHAAYGYDQRIEVLGAAGMLQAGNHRPTEVIAALAGAVSSDVPEPFFLDRYRRAYALEMAHFANLLAGTARPVPGLVDGIKALELAELATRSWREARALTCLI